MSIKSFSLTLCVFLCISGLKFCSGEEDEVPVVRVKQGLVKGIKDKSLKEKEFYSYMGIPFAEPPEGKLRFKDPVPLEAWDGILDGTKPPVSCLQVGFFNLPNTITVSGKEDCLRLNVYTSAPNQQEKKLPVMVFIHGGAFVLGSANEYQPYVLMNEEIVLVVIQYRVGIFGFLSTEDSVMPGNTGLKDQQLALKWVKENIESFGGDSNSITIFGESAGGASVHYQVLSPGSKGLFNRAIIQSGTALCPWASNKDHRKFAIETGQEFNCSIEFGTEKYRECMQNVNPYYLTIAAAQTPVWGLSPYYVLPRVDGEFIDEAPEILMRKGKYNKVDIIQGITRDEGGLDLFFAHSDPKRNERFNSNFEYYGPISLFFQSEENSVDLARQVYQYYLRRKDVSLRDNDWKEIVDLNSDRMFRMCHDTVAKFFAKDQNITFYTYQLDHYASAGFDDIIPGFDRRGVISHGDDLIFLFYGGEFLKIKLEEEDDLKIREIFLELWTNFAKTGNPTPQSSDFDWIPTTANSYRYLSLTTTPTMKDDNFQKNRKFWSDLKTSENYLLQKSLKEL